MGWLIVFILRADSAEEHDPCALPELILHLYHNSDTLQQKILQIFLEPFFGLM